MSARVRELLRSPLALKIYLVGLAQIAVVAFGFHGIMVANGPPGPGGGPPLEGWSRVVARDVERVAGDRAALGRELARIHEDVGATVTVRDSGGAVVASSDPGRAPTCDSLAEPDPADAVPPRMRCASVPVALSDGRGRLDLLMPAPRRPPRPPLPATRIIPLVLLVVGVSSLLLARSLARPLRKMSSAARAFGGGDLAARAGVRRGDELGDVARSFDEMADRVTELLRAEKELLANVSHELRTPLARIRVALDLAAEGDAEVARESLADIGGDLDELERLITDVLTAARLDLGDGSSPAGIPPLRRQAIDARELLEHAASRFRAAHPRRRLEVLVPEELPAIDGDPVLLRRVVDNLLENAHKYTDKPELPVVLRAGAGRELRVEVIDQGIGIAAEDLARVFRPFFRADRSRTRATGGLGLGLALAKRIVDAHGGTIELESAPGKGTVARVRLPIAGGR